MFDRFLTSIVLIDLCYKVKLCMYSAILSRDEISLLRVWHWWLVDDKVETVATKQPKIIIPNLILSGLWSIMKAMHFITESLGSKCHLVGGGWCSCPLLTSLSSSSPSSSSSTSSSPSPSTSSPSSSSFSLLSSFAFAKYGLTHFPPTSKNYQPDISPCREFNHSWN